MDEEEAQLSPLESSVPTFYHGSHQPHVAIEPLRKG